MVYLNVVCPRLKLRLKCQLKGFELAADSFNIKQDW